MKHNSESEKANIGYRISWLIALLIAVFVVVLPFYKADAAKKEYQIVMLGDSLYSGWGEDGYIATALGQALGKSVFNGCMGGSSISWSGEEYDYLSLYSLSKSIVSGDFTQQKTTHINTPATMYFEELIEELSQVDFDKVELLLLKYGLNDYHMGQAIEGSYATDPYSYLGALEYSLNLLQERYPKLRIVLVTPCFAWYTERNDTCENLDFGGGNLEKYVDAELDYARNRGIEIIDQYHDFFPSEKMEDWPSYMADGMHLNEDGQKLAAKQLIEYFTTNKEGK